MAVSKLNSADSYSNCFELLNEANNAIERGQARKAALILSSLQNDASVLQRHSKIYHEGLRRLEEKQMHDLESLMRQSDKLNHNVESFKEQEMSMKAKRKWLTQLIEEEEENYVKSERKCREAIAEQQEAERKLNELKTWWWVPVVGQILAVEELFVNNRAKEQEAKREMERCYETSNDARKKIDEMSSNIDKVEDVIQHAKKRQEELKEEIEKAHHKIGATKDTTVFLHKAAQLWDEISLLSNCATFKTERLRKVLRLAAEQNTVKILKSNGTKTLVGSFNECWMEIEDMMRNDLVFPEEGLKSILNGNTGLPIAEDDQGVYLVDQSKEIVSISRYFMLINMLLVFSVYIEFYSCIVVPVFCTIYHILSFPLSIILRFAGNVTFLVFQIILFSIRAISSLAFPILAVLLGLLLVAFFVGKFRGYSVKY